VLLQKPRKHVQFDTSYRPRSSESIDRREAMAKMNQALKDPGYNPELKIS
jgi:hypothetical protein